MRASTEVAKGPGHGTPVGRTAIIAVHGVGGPERGSTARAVARMLLTQDPSRTDHTYTPFGEYPVTLPTSPLIAPEPETRQTRALKRVRQAFNALAQSFRTPDRTPRSAAGEDAGIAFMDRQLEGYVSQRTPYESVELISERQAGGERRKVHVYEVHWADLSQMGAGFLRLLGTVYQIILHLSHLGRKTLDSGENYRPAGADDAPAGDAPASEAHGAQGAPVQAAARPRPPRTAPEQFLWRVMAGSHAWAVRIFCLVVPVLSVLVLFALALLAPELIIGKVAWHGVVSIVLAVLLALVGVTVVAFWLSRKAGGALFTSVMTLLAVGVAGFLIYKKAGLPASVLATTLRVEIPLIAGVLFAVFLRVYGRNQPGAQGWGWTAALAVGALSAAHWSLVGVVPPDSGLHALQAFAFEWIQWSYVLLVGAWLLFWAATAVAVVTWAILRYTTEDDEARDQLRRAGWTARVSLATGVFSYTIATSILFSYIVKAFTANGGYIPLIPEVAVTPVFAPLLPLSGTDAALGTRAFLQVLIEQGATIALPLSVALVLLALVWSGWFIVVLLVTVLKSMKPGEAYGEKLGHWFSVGLGQVRWSGNMFAVGVLGASLLGVISHFYAPLQELLKGGAGGFLSVVTTRDLIEWLSYAVAGSVAGLTVLRFRLSAAYTITRPAVGIMLDVDHYMRESPVDATPRARMAERFATLLRHAIVRREPGTEAPYFDRIIIVAHSQGTVIAADLLRYVTKRLSHDPTLDLRRVSLLTFGSPLRQLYAAHFPYQYDWVERRVGGEYDGPVIADLGITRWINLYTTADYVGRSLWRDEAWKHEGADAAVDQDGYRERCLGAGTHTRYWQHAGVAEEIDREIVRAAADTATGEERSDTAA